jgi:hypothetical protein
MIAKERFLFGELDDNIDHWNVSSAGQYSIKLLDAYIGVLLSQVNEARCLHKHLKGL